MSLRSLHTLDTLENLGDQHLLQMSPLEQLQLRMQLGRDQQQRDRDKMVQLLAPMQMNVPMPPSFIPYLDRHRIYQLFHELAADLLMHRPKDHVEFLKRALQAANRRKDRPRIILLAPPFFDLEELARRVAQLAGVPRVLAVEREYTEKKDYKGCRAARMPGESLSAFCARVLRLEPLVSSGWLIAGFPRSDGEAMVMQRAGVFPTHVVLLVPSVTENDTCMFSRACKFTPDIVAQYVQYQRRLRGLREVFKSVLREIDIRGRDVESLAQSCMGATRTLPNVCAPTVFRVLLLGPTGSGRHTQARRLVERFKLVLVDYDEEALRFRQGDWPRLKNAAEGRRPLLARERMPVILKRLAKPDCVGRGWVLVGFPLVRTDMQALDESEMPPNRVLVLKVPLSECTARLEQRRYNKFTGSQHRLTGGKLYPQQEAQFVQHPEDLSQRIHAKLKQYQEGLPGLLDYLGDTAVVLPAGLRSPDRVFEMVSAALMTPPTAAATAATRIAASAAADTARIAAAAAADHRALKKGPVPARGLAKRVVAPIMNAIVNAAVKNTGREPEHIKAIVDEVVNKSSPSSRGIKSIIDDVVEKAAWTSPPVKSIPDDVAGKSILYSDVKDIVDDVLGKLCPGPGPGSASKRWPVPLLEELVDEAMEETELPASQHGFIG